MLSRIVLCFFAVIVVALTFVVVQTATYVKRGYEHEKLVSDNVKISIKLVGTRIEERGSIFSKKIIIGPPFEIAVRFRINDASSKLVRINSLKVVDNGKSVVYESGAIKNSPASRIKYSDGSLSNYSLARFDYSLDDLKSGDYTVFLSCDIDSEKHEVEVFLKESIEVEKRILIWDNLMSV